MNGRAINNVVWGGARWEQETASLFILARLREPLEGSRKVTTQYSMPQAGARSNK